MTTKTGIDIFIGIHPKRIKTLQDAEDILRRIKAYESAFKCKAGVLYTQNRSLGGILAITSNEEAREELTKPIRSEPRTHEWGLEFYTRTYFEALREQLRGNNAYPLPEPLTREQYKK